MRETRPVASRVVIPVGRRVSPTGRPRRPRRAPLSGRYVSLRPVRPSLDVEELFACSHGSAEKEALWTYMAYGPFGSPARMERWLTRCAGSRDPLFFTLRERSSKRAVGMASFLNVVPAMRRLELGHIWLAPEVQRSRVLTETTHLMLSHAFDDLCYRRVEWKCDSLNERSRRAALRLGFSFEGLFRDHMIVKGRNRDTAWFALCEPEWKRVRAAQRAWLVSPLPPPLRTLLPEPKNPPPTLVSP
jgi:RimJ/RimL family protein N-acetyltransferase